MCGDYKNHFVIKQYLTKYNRPKSAVESETPHMDRIGCYDWRLTPPIAKLFAFGRSCAENARNLSCTCLLTATIKSLLLAACCWCYFSPSHCDMLWRQV